MPATYTVEEAAEVIGISRNSAYEAIKRGEIPSIKIGRRILVPKDALHRMLSEARTAAPPQHTHATGQVANSRATERLREEFGQR